jgi:hypothetical protein
MKSLLSSLFSAMKSTFSLLNLAAESFRMKMITTMTAVVGRKAGRNGLRERNGDSPVIVVFGHV